MRKHTGMMKKLADGFLRSHAKASPVTSPTSLPTKSFSCVTCGKKFPTLQAASTHERTVHRRRQIGADYINESGRCPVCKRTFHTRLRGIEHVASVAACREREFPREIMRRSQRHPERSLTMLIVSKLVSPGNLASVYTDHTGCELHDHSLLFFFSTPHVRPICSGQLRWLDRTNCSILLSFNTDIWSSQLCDSCAADF